MSGQESDPQSILELMSRNLDEPPSDLAKSELVELLRTDSESRDTWIAEVTLNRSLQNYFQESRDREQDDQIRRIAEMESRRRRRRNILKALGIGGGLAATTLVLIALLLPAVQQARPAARRTTTTDNLKQIGLGLNHCQEIRGGYPTAYSVDEQGSPLLSWRVLLLPYLDEEELFEKFHLDEPWNSPHNLTLLQEMPAVFRSPLSSREDHTVYLAVPIEGGVIRPPIVAGAENVNPVGVTIGDVRDGLSNTVMVVEVADELAVPWTRPHDYPVAPEFADVTLPAVSHALDVWKSQNKVICDRVVLADGTVREVADGISKAMITRSGGEILTESDW